MPVTHILEGAGAGYTEQVTQVPVTGTFSKVPVQLPVPGTFKIQEPAPVTGTGTKVPGADRRSALAVWGMPIPIIQYIKTFGC